MSLTALMVDDVSVVRAATVTDRYGNPSLDWANAASTATKAWVSQQSRSEDQTYREAEIGGWIAYLPAGTDITGADRLTWGDYTFEVAAPPNPAHTPRGAHHLEVQLKYLTG